MITLRHGKSPFAFKIVGTHDYSRGNEIEWGLHVHVLWYSVHLEWWRCTQKPHGLRKSRTWRLP